MKGGLSEWMMARMMLFDEMNSLSVVGNIGLLVINLSQLFGPLKERLFVWPVVKRLFVWPVVTLERD